MEDEGFFLQMTTSFGVFLNVVNLKDCVEKDSYPIHFTKVVVVAVAVTEELLNSKGCSIDARDFITILL